MATHVLRPGPTVIQRANSLQASDTSHTSASTTDASTNTSASHAKLSPVSSIGESISSVVHQLARPPARPLPVPPLAPPTAPGLSSTSTLKLSHKESHSTLGKSSQPNIHRQASNSPPRLTKPKSAPHKLTRSRLGPASSTQATSAAPAVSPPASSPGPASDDGWVSVSVQHALPVLSEHSLDGRLHQPGSTHSPKPVQPMGTARHASLAGRPDSKAPTGTGRTASKSLPRLPEPLPRHTERPPQPQDSAWKLEFRGVVRLVRWVSRREKDKRDSAAEGATEGADPHRDEKLVVEHGGPPVPVLRKGFSVSNEDRRARDSYNQPMPRPNAPTGMVRARPLSIVRPHPKIEIESAGNKRRTTKSNPGLAGFSLRASSVERSKSQASHSPRPSLDAGAPDTRQTNSNIGISSNAGGVFVPDVPLGLPAFDPRVPRPAVLSPANSALPAPDVSSNTALSAQPEVPAALAAADRFGEGDDTITFLPPASFSPSTTHVTTVTRSTERTFQPPFSITQVRSSITTTTTQTVVSPYSAHSVLSPVLEVPGYTPNLVASPSELRAESRDFPWQGTSNAAVRVGEIVPMGSAIFRGGDSAIVTRVSTAQTDGTQVETVVAEVVGSTPAAAVEALAGVVCASASPVTSSVSPTASGSLSPLSDSSASVSPLISASVSPLMSNVASTSASSPAMPASTPLADCITPIRAIESSSSSYATAPSIQPEDATAQVALDERYPEIRRQASMALGSARNEAPCLFRPTIASEIGHGYSTRATSPTHSDRDAFSEDPHGSQPVGGILRKLYSMDHSNEPLPMPRRPLIPSHGSSGSVTFDDSSAQSSPRLGGRRKMMTMSASDVGFTGRPFARPEVQRSKSSLNIAGRIMRKLSSGSASRIEDESERRSGTSRKLVRRRGMPSRSTASLPFGHDGSAVPPVPPLPPGVTSGRFNWGAQSEIGHGMRSDAGHDESDIGHGYIQSEVGHSRGDSIGYGNWGDSTSVLGHGSTVDHSVALVSPTPTRVSFATTQSAPATSTGRNRLVKKSRKAPRRATFVESGRSLASLDFPDGNMPNYPPRITTEFVMEPLSMGHDSEGVDAMTDDGHLMLPRPGLPRRTSSQRRWTIADMDDDEFLRQLEAKLSGSGSRLRKSRVLEEFAMGADQDHEQAFDADLGSETDDSAAGREWTKACQAMMCVREIVRMEKSYLRHMVGFLNGQQSAISSVLQEHLPRLIEASRAFSAHLEEDPSAWGVSRAFLAVEEQLEAALVDWCGVVAPVISPKHRNESQSASEDGHTSSAGSSTVPTSWIRRRSATASSVTQPFQLNLTMTPVIGGKDKKSIALANTKRMTEQDVAIRPTQQVLRYVLLYRELLVLTPEKYASRPLVERALEGATRIAKRCDEAQTNVDMLSPS